MNASDPGRSDRAHQRAADLPDARQPVLRQPAAGTSADGAAGSLRDTDLARETAQLTELQNRQRRSLAMLPTASRTPRTLRSLFGDA